MIAPITEPRRQVKKNALAAIFFAVWIPLQAQEAVTSTNTFLLPENTTTNTFSPASWRYKDWRGFVMFSALVRYDDNILQVDRNVLSDFVGVAIPSVNMDYMPSSMDGTVVAHLDYTPQFVAYFEHPQYDAIDQAANAKLEGTSGRSQYKAGALFNSTTEPNLEQTGLTRMETEEVDLYGGYEVTAKTTLSLAPRAEWASVENGVAVWECGAAAEATYLWSEKLNLTASYYGAQAYATPGVASFKQAVLGGFLWQASGRSSLQLKAGFQTMTYDSSASGPGSLQLQPGFQTTTSGSSPSSGRCATPDFLLDWVWLATGKTTARVKMDYQTDYSKFVAYQVNESFSSQVVLSHAASEKIGLELRGRWVLMNQVAELQNQINGGEFQYWCAGCGIIYHLNHRTDIRLDYDRQQRGSSLIYTPYQRDIAQLAIQYRF
jgi:hypothetical protein